MIPAPVCRDCGCLLVEGTTWAPARAKKKDRWCTTCASAYHLRWRANNPEKWAAYLRVNKRTLRTRWKAALRRKGFDLSLGEYADMMVQPCAYCGGPLTETGVSLDQKIPGAGYARDNIAPCCGVCNTAKNDYFTYGEMRDVVGPAIRQVRENREKNDTPQPSA